MKFNIWFITMGFKNGGRKLVKIRSLHLHLLVLDLPFLSGISKKVKFLIRYISSCTNINPDVT